MPRYDRAAQGGDMDGPTLKTLVLVLPFAFAFATSASCGEATMAAPTPACLATAPVDGATLTAANPESFKFDLEWRPLDGVGTYLLEVGTTPEMAPGTRALSVKLPMTQYTVGGLKPGHYY